MKNKLLVLEGTDTSGKSTQIKLIKKYLDNKELKHTSFHFPTYEHNIAGNIVASYLRGEYGDINKVNPFFIANIYAMDRFLYLSTLKEDLEKNDIVILDRYVFSNMAYQGAKYETKKQSDYIKEWIYNLEFDFMKLPYPDLNIFFDVPIDIIEKRLSNMREGKERDYLKGATDIHEKDISFQIKVKNNYLTLDKYPNFFIIPTENLAPEFIFEKYKNKIDELLT